MTVGRSVKKALVLVVAGGALAAAILVGDLPVASGAARESASLSDGRGNPNAVPPILRAASASELAAIRRQEARAADAFSYRLPLTAPYSDAEMDAYAIVCSGGC
jgi:hypothetical protein